MGLEEGDDNRPDGGGKRPLDGGNGSKGRKLKKTYFFTPCNTLNGGDRREETKIHKVPEIQPKAVAKIPEPSHDLDQGNETLNSDESFEGIKWRTSPRSKKTRLALSSSPLKNIVTDNAVATIDPAELLLLKYGPGFQNIVTPKASKTTSDIIHEPFRPPSLERAKSLSALESSSNNSKLGEWISKFDTDKENVPEVSDPFSDDEEFFASVKMAQEDKDDFSDFDDLKLPSTEYSNDINDLKSIIDENNETPAFAYTRPDLKRYEIVDMLHSSYKVSLSTRKQIIMTVKNNLNKESKIIVRGDYCTLDFCKGDIINIIVTDPKTANVVDDSQNLLIWHPDVLVSATTVAQQLTCPRKSVLNDRFNFPGISSTPLMIGIILHEIFQSCFIKDSWVESEMQEEMHELTQSYSVTIYSVGPDAMEHIRKEISSALPYLKEWADKYYKHKGIRSQLPTTNNKQVLFSVNKALDIEESIWSPLFGLKGKVDVTLEAEVQEGSTKKGNFLIPMEIKTGREYISHHAQSSLYALLFKDRYNLEVNCFMLVYTKEKISKLGEIKPSEVRALANLRNRVASYLKENVRELPPVMKTSACDRCEVKRECMTLHYLVEDGTPESSGIDKEEFNELTNHLNDKQTYKDFYTYWDILITKEEYMIKRLKKELWIQTAQERETRNGKALANLVLKELNEQTEKDGIYLHHYKFTRSPSSELNLSFQLSQISRNDKVMISDELGHFTIANAFVTQIRPEFITVIADRRISKSNTRSQNFNSSNNQAFESVLTSSKSDAVELNITFRIDKDEMFHGMGLARYNILEILMADSDSRNRTRIIDLRPPQFESVEQPGVDKYVSLFNPDQIRAFKHVLAAQDYALILGMPGTGKTTLIAALINYLVLQGKSVLLTSYTNSAVDNILLKLMEYKDVDILRIGLPSRIHKDIQKFCPRNLKSYDEYAEKYINPPVVGTTCLGINDSIFSIRDKFDYCIIDEASQVSLPVSLGPLRYADKFVLVGDHNQLPPLVQHQHPSVKKGLSKSLFQVLNDSHPSSVVELTYQYRMCADIMELSNQLIYNNRLKCGSEVVANQKLAIPNPEGYKSMVTGDRDFWMKWVLNEKNKVIFLDHDLVPAVETAKGEKIENRTEAKLIWQIVEALTMCGVSESSIGLMSLYRAQLRILNKYALDKPDIEVMTADQFQGRDKDCIIISLVRSNKERKIGDLLQEWRRINVALTRAKKKLIILGSRQTLSLADGVLKDFLELIHKNKWMYRLPPKATSYYSLVHRSSQSQSQHRRTPNKSPRTPKVVKQMAIVSDILNDIQN